MTADMPVLRNALLVLVDETQPVSERLSRVTDIAILAENQRQQFGLERHLHDFMRDNWDQIDLSAEWALYQEPGDRGAVYKYPTDIGRIDLLAKHKRKLWWLVIELKRNQTSEQAVGQLLRYIGWVKQHLADQNDDVHGLIICREADDTPRYALIPTSKIQLKLYEVEFHLREP